MKQGAGEPKSYSFKTKVRTKTTFKTTRVLIQGSKDVHIKDP